MRHLNSVNKLNKTASHRHAMLANLAMSILDKERVITTLAKAKVVRGVVERLITHAKKGGLHKVRIVAEIVHDKAILNKLFTDIAPSFKDREGGYTRILKLGERPGDNALLCIIELTGRNGQELALARKKKKKAGGTADTSGTQKAAANVGAASQAATDSKHAADTAGEANNDEAKDAGTTEEVKKEKPKAAPKKKKKAQGEGDVKPDKDKKKK
jgi:large subunit ribosomal protein L17